MYKVVAPIIAAALVAACATAPTPIAEAASAPPERVFREQASGENLARAIFVRDSGFLGAGLSQRLFINGQVAAKLNAGEKVEIFLQPGDYVFGVRKEADVFSQYNDNSIDQNLVGGRTYHYRILSDASTYDTRILRVMGGQ